jgi:peptidyl-prolyl cis-trans isomerase D
MPHNPWLAAKPPTFYDSAKQILRRGLSPTALLKFKGRHAMMEALRNGAKGWVAKVLLTLLIASFAVWGITDVFRGFQSKDLLEVGDQSISSETFRLDLNRSLEQMSRQTGSSLSLEDARKLGLNQQVLDRMISQASVDAQAKRLGITIADQAVATSIQKQKVFQDTNGKFDVTRFRSLLQQNGMNEQGFVQNEKSNLLRNSLSGIAESNVVVPRTLLEALTRYRDETRDARYVSFTVNASDVPQPSDDELKKQYDATPTAYTAPEYRSIAVLKIEPKDLVAKTQVADQEIKDAYDTFKVEYYEPERRDILQLSFTDIALAAKAKVRLDAGEDIMKVAADLGQKEKDITFSAALIGDFLDPKIGDAAFALKEGQISAPVAGLLNTAVLKATKITAARQPSLEDLKSVLKERLQLEKARDEIQSVYNSVEDDRAQQTKFEDIASKTGATLTIVPAISAAGVDKAGQPVELPSKEELLKAAFAGVVGVDIDAISANEGYVWLDMREVIASAVKPLDIVKEQVKADWSAAKLRTLASDKAKAIVEKAGSNSRLESVATELARPIKSVSGIKRNNTSEDFDGVATLALFSVGEKALTWTLEGDGKTARIIEVSKVTAPIGTATASSKEVQDLARQGLGSDLLDSYLKSARAGTTVTLNDELWRQINGETQTQ